MTILRMLAAGLLIFNVSWIAQARAGCNGGVDGDDEDCVVPSPSPSATPRAVAQPRRRLTFAYDFRVFVKHRSPAAAGWEYRCMLLTHQPLVATEDPVPLPQPARDLTVWCDTEDYAPHRERWDAQAHGVELVGVQRSVDPYKVQPYPKDDYRLTVLPIQFTDAHAGQLLVGLEETRKLIGKDKARAVIVENRPLMDEVDSKARVRVEGELGWGSRLILRDRLTVALVDASSDRMIDAYEMLVERQVTLVPEDDDPRQR